MSYKPKYSQAVHFLNETDIDLTEIRRVLSGEDAIAADVKTDVLGHLDTIIGGQEKDWLVRNGTHHLIDYVMHRYKFKYYPKKRVLGHFPLHLLIEPTSVCNLKCIMCFQTDKIFSTPAYRGLIDYGLFTALIDQAVEHGCRAVTLSSRGEPTLHPDFGKMLAYCKNKFFELKINTNATKLTKEVSMAILDAGVDIVVFSVDSYMKNEYERIRMGACFEEVFENIKQFCALKNADARYAKTATRISGVYLDERQSKEKFLACWGDIVDTVTFSDGVPRWDTYNNPLMQCSAPCSYLWERMYVWYDGTCNPCDYDYKSSLAVGNAKENALADIWQGEQFQHIRNSCLIGKRDTLYPCNRCNVY